MGVGVGVMLGILRVVKCDPKACVDIIPADCVVNSALVVAAKPSAGIRNQNIFNCVSCNVASLSFGNEFISWMIFLTSKINLLKNGLQRELLRRLKCIRRKIWSGCRASRAFLINMFTDVSSSSTIAFQPFLLTLRCEWVARSFDWWGCIGRSITQRNFIHFLTRTLGALLMTTCSIFMRKWVTKIKTTFHLTWMLMKLMSNLSKRRTEYENII